MFKIEEVTVVGSCVVSFLGTSDDELSEEGTLQKKGNCKEMEKYFAWEEGVGRRGGVKSRSDLPDFKSSNVEFKAVE